MTRETLETANHIIHDIEILQDLMDEMIKKKWVGAVIAEEPKKVRTFDSDILYDDFEKFVENELEILNKELEEM